MSHRQQRLTPEGELAHERATDNDSWARLTSTLERYKVFWLLAFAFGGWLRTRLTQPLSVVPVLQAQNAVILHRLDAADSSRAEMGQVLKVFGKFICAQMTAGDRYRYDIDCKELPPPDLKSVAR